MEVLGLAGQNLSNKEIAKKMHISLYTVKNHLHIAYEKLHVGSRRAAVQKLFNLNLGESECNDCPYMARAAIVSGWLKKIAEELHPQGER